MDYGAGGTGFIVQAHSRQQIDQIFDLPNTSYIKVWEGSIEDNPLYQFHMNRSGRMLTYDVDKPEGTLEHYMVKNKVILPR